MNALRLLPQPLTPRSAAAPIAGAARLCVECVDVARLADHAAAWTDLCTRLLEPNIFLDPAFALSLFRHDDTCQRWRFLLVWEEGEMVLGRLLGLFVVDLPRQRGGTARASVHKQTSNGTPLVDRAKADQVVAAALDWLAARSTAFVVPSTVKDGPFAVALLRACSSSGRRLVVLEERTRAVLNRELDDTGRVASFASARRRQQYGRQARRLAKKGERTFSSASTPAELTLAAEHFLELEHDGWKGARGTALLARPELAAFARTMIGAMGESGRCRIDAVEIDGRPVAMGIILTDRGRAHFWKIAFDATYAAFSPGVQLALELTRRQLGDPRVVMTDSCAEANHPMIDRLWPDRLMMIDLIVAVTPDRPAAFALCLHIERVRRATRRLAKSAWVRLRRARRD